MKNKVRILPDNIKEFNLIYQNNDIDLKIFEAKNKEYVNYPIYNIPISTALLKTREIINKTYRLRINPWCNASNEINRSKNNYGFLTMFSIWCWEWYSYMPILLAFQKNKLIAERIIPIDIESYTGFSNFKIRDSLVNLKVKLWWDIKNKSYFGVPVNVNNFLCEYDVDNNRILRKIKML